MAGRALVTIRNKQWDVSVAVTPWELTQGLGGLTGMPAGSGMLFDLGALQIIQVTTVPMLFSLDIAFLSETLVITEVYRNIQPGYLVTSTLPARYFIEVNAGELEGIDSGDRASVEVIAPAQSIVPDWASALIGLIGFVVIGFMVVSIMRDFVKGLLEEPKEKLKILPQTEATFKSGEIVKYKGEKVKVLEHIGDRASIWIPSRQEEVWVKPDKLERIGAPARSGKFVIERDRMGNIIVTHTERPKRSVFLQFEADKELVYDILKKPEREDLDRGWNVEVKDSEPRASILRELWEASARSEGPRLPEEARKDILFVEYIRDLVRLGERVTDEEAKIMWDAWKKREREARPLTQVIRKPEIMEYRVEENVPYGTWAVVELWPTGTVRSPFKTKEEAIKREEEIGEFYGWKLKKVEFTRAEQDLLDPQRFPKRTEALDKLKGHDVIEVHDDGDLTVRSRGKFYVVTTEGQTFEQKEHLAQTIREASEGKPTSTCYADAWRFLIKEEEGELIHGTVFSGGRRIGHAWVETPTGYMWEPETGRYFTRLGFKDAFAPVIESRYTAEEAAIMAARTKNLGPWAEQERHQYLKEKSPATIPEHPQQPRLKGEIEFLPDSPEFLAYTIEDIGYREKIDSAFQEAIRRAKGPR